MHRVTAFVVCFLLLSPPLAAQARLEAGDRVRLVLEPGSGGPRVLEGTVVDLFPEELSVRTAQGDVRAVDVRVIRELYGFSPKDRSRAARRGAWLGGFIGGSLGLVVAPIVSSSLPNDNLGVTMLVAGAGGAAVGALSGALLGSQFARDGWQKYRIPENWPRASRESVGAGAAR